MRSLTTLAAHCAAQGTPYYELSARMNPWPTAALKIGGPGANRIGSPQVYVGNVRNVHVFGHTYLRHGDTFIVDGQGFALDPDRNGFDEYAAISDNRPKVPYAIPDECIFIGGAWHDPDPSHGVPNFGHFMWEYASRLAIFDRAGLLHLPAIIYQSVPERWLDFLRLAGVDNFIYTDPASPPNYANVWVTSCPFQRDVDNQYMAWGPAVHWLRNRLTRGVDIRRRRRVYIGRGTSKWRHIINETEVVEFLASRGFEVVDPAAQTAATQVATMAEADVVIMAQGAGNIMSQFCPEHARVIILAPEGAGGMWGGMAHAIVLRQSYSWLFGRRIPRDDGMKRMNRYGMDEMADFVIDVADLRAAVDACGL